MEWREPESMDECLYFTNRENEFGKVKAWVFRKECPKCHKALMGKPINSKTGKPKTRSDVYVCPNCGYEEDKKEHEESSTVMIDYVCADCGHQGKTTTPYKRKTWMGVKAYVFVCDGCGKKIGIVKKMKAPKKKKK